MDILEEISLLNVKSNDTHMDQNVKLIPKQKSLYQISRRYVRLVGKLNYLTFISPDIFADNVVRQFLNSPCQKHMDVEIRNLKYIKSASEKCLIYEDTRYTQIVEYLDANQSGSPINLRSTYEYCVLVKGNFAFEKSKKQNAVARSNIEAKQKDIALVTWELIVLIVSI